MITQHLAPQTTPLNSCPQAHPKPNIVRDGSLPLRRVSCTVTPQTNPATSRPTHHPSRRPSRFKSLPREHYAPRPQATCIVYPHRTPSPLLASVRIPHAAAISLRHRSRAHRSQRTGRVLRVRSAPTPSYVRFARTSYTLQPRSTSRSLLVVLELAGTTGHPAGSAAVLSCAVSGTPRYTAESSKVCGGNAHTSLLLDCRGRREKQWTGSQLTPHTCVGVLPPSYSCHPTVSKLTGSYFTRAASSRQGSTGVTCLSATLESYKPVDVRACNVHEMCI
jgi:hypothetical protein